MKLKILPYDFIAFSIAFILFTPIGTLSHEYGHIIAAKSLGYETTLHYGSMNYSGQSKLRSELKEIYNQNEEAIKNKEDFEGREYYEIQTKKRKRHRFLIRVSGPLQTMLTGLLGLIIILFRRRKRQDLEFVVWDWIAIFLSMFWLREIFNLVVSVSTGLIKQNGKFFGGDELVISKMLNLPDPTIPITFGILGLLIVCFIIFKIIPKNKQFTFLFSGLIGGGLGFFLWMKVLGPQLLP